MPSAFHGIDLASRALRSFQRGLDVTGHNIANVNTPGYSRQTISFGQTDPTTFYGMRAITLGTGVSVSTVNRVRDLFLEGRRSTEQAEFGRFSALAQNLSRIEGLMPMGPGGIGDALDRFFNSWSALSANPSEPGVRQEVQLAGQTLALRVRSTYGDLHQFRTLSQN
ncbi:MAG TPA: flagellar basal body protein, partial [Fimbriimonadaceae bacterium]|nr:flagellar basal body protein [Fimbriimonadaceae bacterium]